MDGSESAGSAAPPPARGASPPAWEGDAPWRTLFESVPVGLLLLDEAAPLEIRAFNDRVAGMLGYTRDEFARLSLVELDADRTADAILEDARRIYRMPAGTRLERPLRHRCRDGSIRDLLATVLRVDEAGRRRVYSASIDVTERLDAERALREADRRKDEFLATLAHELRNPLAPLRNGLEALRRLGLGDRADDIVALCARQVHHMGRLVDDLLEVSRITRGIVALRPERLQVAPAVLAVVEALGPRIDGKRQRIECETGDGASWVDADPTRFAQIVENLLTNASKYSPEGARILLRTTRRDGEAIVAVTDEGVGIAAADLERVFEMFVQLDPTIDRAGGGLGIGLALARRLAEAHGGTVRVSSPGPGRGSTFELALPLAPLPADGRGR